MSSVIVTGGAGFIGSHLAARLAGAGHDVHVIVRPKTDRRRLAGIAGRVTVHAVASDDGEGLSRCFATAAPEQVFHLASQSRPAPGSLIDDIAGRIAGDIAFLLAIVKAAANAPRPPATFVRAASLAEYGAVPAPYKETDKLRPLTPYGASMAACTQVLEALTPTLPFAIAQGRLALVYGPGQSTTFLVATMIESFTAGRPVEIRNPESRRDLIHIDDAVDGLLRLSDRDIRAVGTVNICTGVGVSMREAAETILAATGAARELLRFAESPLEDGASDLWGSTDLAGRSLGWRARFDFSEGVRRTLARLRHDEHSSGRPS